MATKTKTETTTIEELAIERLTLLDELQMRERTSEEVVQEYQALYEQQVVLPPPVAFLADGNYYVADGFHRIPAAERAGLGSLAVEVHQGGKEEALLYSCGANQSHGLRRSNEDKRKAVVSLLKVRPKWSNGRIAKHCGVDDKTVAATRKSMESTAEIPESDEREGLDGRSYKVPQSKPDSNSTPEFPESNGQEDPDDVEQESDSEPEEDQPEEEQEELKDKAGNVVPGHLKAMLSAYWTKQKEVESFGRSYEKAMRELSQMPAGEGLRKSFTQKGTKRINVNLDKAQVDVRTSAPHAVCPKCDGTGEDPERDDSCSLCQGLGWVNGGAYRSYAGSL